MDSPSYPYKPINSLKSLSLMLGEPQELLVRVSERANKMYRLVPQKKKDGSPRDTFDAYELLKRIQKKIVGKILVKVSYPKYLHGGIRDLDSPRSIFSNAGAHAGARTIIMQDIEDFFPSIISAHVRSIFRGCFGFSEEVSNVLVGLTTKDGAVPQGACTSSYIANLVFWDVEPALYQELKEKGVIYTRFADDMASSSKRSLSNAEISEVVSSVVAMLKKKGCRQKRKKLNIRWRGQALKGKDREYDSLTVTSLTVQDPDGVGVSQRERSKVRSAVKEVELLAHSDSPWSEVEKKYQSAMGRIGRLITCGYTEGRQLRARLNSVKALYTNDMALEDSKVFFVNSGVVTDMSINSPPWED